MKLTSKFDEGAVVWFLNNMGGDQAAKFLEGTINSVQNWDKWSGFRYDISHVNPEGVEMSYNVEERNIYKTKNDVLTNAFEENGTLPTPEAPATEETPAA